MDTAERFDLSGSKTLYRWGTGLLALGGVAVIFALWMVFFYVPTESTMGVIQRIYYIHIPTAWLGEMAFGIVGLCSLGYLMLREDRLDAIALSAAEVGFVFWTATLFAGPLWARVAWGTWWEWDARLSFSLLLWFIWVGYFMLRQATDNPEDGKRFAAIMAIVGAVDIPFIHMSVYWFRTIHPRPVVMNPEGPTADFEIGMTILAAVVAYTVFFFGLLCYRYGFERLDRRVKALGYPYESEDRYTTSGAPT